MRQILDRGDTVFATARSPDKASELQQLRKSTSPGSLHILELDVCVPESIASAAKIVENTLQDGGIDYLISNAGILVCHVLV